MSKITWALLLLCVFFVSCGKDRATDANTEVPEHIRNYAQDHYSWEVFVDWWETVPDTTKQIYSHSMPWDSTTAQPIFNFNYYEYIGIYNQFQVGWDDIGPNFPPPPTGQSYISPHRAHYLNLWDDWQN
jgi:hypothetical protein